MSNPIVGLGTSFEFATVLSPTTFTVLAGVNSIAFSGIVESLTVAYPLDKPATLDVKIKITGPVTYV